MEHKPVLCGELGLRMWRDHGEVAVRARRWGPWKVRLKALHFLMSVDQYISEGALDCGGQLKVFSGESSWARGEASSGEGTVWGPWPSPASLHSSFTHCFSLERFASIPCHI